MVRSVCARNESPSYPLSKKGPEMGVGLRRIYKNALCRLDGGIEESGVGFNISIGYDGINGDEKQFDNGQQGNDHTNGPHEHLGQGCYVFMRCRVFTASMGVIA